MRTFFAALIGALLAFGPAGAADTTHHKIVSIDGSADARRVSVRIDERLGEAALANLGSAIAARAKAGETVATIAVYLPGGDLAHAPWATLKASASGFDITVSGLTAEDEAALRAEAGADGRAIVGMWLTSPPALPGRLTILRAKGGKLIAEWQLKSGQKTVDDLVAQKTGRGIRYDVVGGDGAYYLAAWGGALELGDKSRVIAVAEHIAIGKPVAVKAAPVLPAPAGDAAKTVSPSTTKAGALAAADATTAVEAKPGLASKSGSAAQPNRPRRPQKTAAPARRKGAPVADLMGSSIAR